METCEKKRSFTFNCSRAESFTRIKRRSFEVFSPVRPIHSGEDEVKTLRFIKRKLSIAATMNQDLFNRFSQVFTEDKSPLDLPSYETLPPELCSSCKLSITNNDELVVLLNGKLYHACCFRCVQCDNRIDTRIDYLLLESGKPLCNTCVPECYACGEIILTEHVRVVDKDFHEKCLSCTYCKMSLCDKVYAREGELCCAKCVVPVFSEEWSHLSAVTAAGNGHVPKAATVPLATPKVSVIKIGRRSVYLNPKLLSLSKNITTITKSTSRATAANDPVPRLNSLIKPSFEVSTSSLAAASTEDKLGISSLSCILCDEVGSTLLLNFCVSDNSIELVVFWLDVEHYKNFDGSRDDLKLLANCIVIKYMTNMAEIPVDLPAEVVEKITKKVKENTTQDIFDEAQQYVYAKMEETIWDRFLRSEDGLNYLEILVARDIQRKRKRESADGFAGRNIMATVKTFDKRHSTSKYYVYEINVEVGSEQFTIYRRYSEFYRLNQELRNSYPNLRFPPFPKKIIFGRSQIRNVADKRMVELQVYLQGILSFPEITAGLNLYDFLKQTADDKENEAFSKRIFAYEYSVQ